MNPSLASLICALGIIGLFYLDHDKTVRTSKALWLAVIYLSIIGSRPASFWLGMSPPAGANVQLDGSPFDAAVFGILLLCAVAVLVQRYKRVLPFLSENWLMLAYFLYCLVSVVWSSHPDVAFKRWTKAIGDPAMVLVVITDRQPVAAFRRLISRIGFVLLPTSVLFIKYYGDLGRAYTPDGESMNTGVTDNKNSLGLILLLISLATVWSVRNLLIHKDAPNRGRRLTAQCTLLAFCLTLFEMAHCSTAIACFTLGSVLIFATNLRKIRARPKYIHALCLAIILAGGLILLSGGEEGAASALGRKSNLSGRTDIWAAVIPAVSNPVVGDGFESFWIGPDVQKVWRSLSGWWNPRGLNEAHDGYIEVYLNLGLIGVFLIAFILISGYLRASNALRRNSELGGLFLSYVVTAAFYNITEAGFRMMSPYWIFLVLAIFSSGGIARGVLSMGRAREMTTQGSLSPRPRMRTSGVGWSARA